MKRFGIGVLMAALVLGSPVYLASCDGGGDSSTPAKSSNNNPGSTTTGAQQGAQSAAASVNTASKVANVATTGTQLSGMVALGGAPALKAFASKSKSSALNKFAARFSPSVRKARAMKSEGNGLTLTKDCATMQYITSGADTPNSFTMTTDLSDNVTMTFTSCREGSEMTNGTMTYSGSGTSDTFTIGADSAPFTVTRYSSPTSSTVENVSKAAVTMTSSTSGAGVSATETMSISGWLEETDYVLHTRSKQSMSNFSMVGAESVTLIGGISYDVATLTMNGSMTDTNYVSDTDSTVDYSETASFTDAEIVYKSPRTYGQSNYDYLNMSGTIILDTTPDDKCGEGTIAVVTDTDVKIDTETGNTVAGKMTINTNTVVTFNADGSVTVSVNGGAAETITDSQLDALCDL